MKAIDFGGKFRVHTHKNCLSKLLTLCTACITVAVPRRIRNPDCNPDWIQARTGGTEFVDFVEPMGVNYYRIAPNNFYRTNDELAKVRVRQT